MTGLVVWRPDATTVPPSALTDVRGLIDPLTGEVRDARDAAAVAAWIVNATEYRDAQLDAALRLAGDLLNGFLDAVNRASDTVQTADGRTYEIRGESQRAANGAEAVSDAEALAYDLSVFVKRGELTADAAEAAVKVKTETTYRPDMRKVRTLASRDDAVGELVQPYIVPAPRPRKRPTVRRVQ